MDEREDELARLLEHARAEAPSAHVLSEVRDRVLSSAAEAAAASTGAASTAAPAAMVKLAWPAKLALGGVAIGAVIAAVFSAALESGEPARAPVAAPARVAPAPVATPSSEPSEPAVIEPAPELAAPGLEPPLETRPVKRARNKVASAAAPAVVEAPEPPSFAEELALIKAALEAQRAGRIDEARAKLAEHARRFPSGQLMHERERIEVGLSQ